MPAGDPTCFPYRLDDCGRLTRDNYNHADLNVFDPKAKRDATAAVATLLDAGWTAEEAYRVLRLVDDQSRETRFGWPDGTVLCGEGGIP